MKKKVKRVCESEGNTCFLIMIYMYIYIYIYGYGDIYDIAGKITAAVHLESGVVVQDISWYLHRPVVLH